MKIGVFGTGMVGTTIGTKLVQLGHDVMMGSRTPDNENAAAWVGEAGGSAAQGTFADAAAHGEILFNCTNGRGTLPALKSAGRDNLSGKVLIDIANPLDFSSGGPELFVSNDDSLAEQIQREFPDTRVVKSLNTINCNVMVDPARLEGPSDVFVSGNDEGAKGQVAEILRGWFGWSNVIDLGDITTARGVESWLPLWIRLWKALGTADFNLKIVR